MSATPLQTVSNRSPARGEYNWAAPRDRFPQLFPQKKILPDDFECAFYSILPLKFASEIYVSHLVNILATRKKCSLE